jgi:glycosyltransferase involved in cell wall biosynthesis
MDRSDYNPLVSVIISAYNSEKYLEEAVYSAAAQTYKNIEIIVIDDGSTDDTKTIGLKLQEQFAFVNYFQVDHSGLPSVTRNIGIRKSVGEFIAFLDADDMWTKSKIEKQTKYLLCHPNDVLCYSMSITFGSVNIFSPHYELLPLPWKAVKTLDELLIKGNSIPLSSVLVRSSLLNEAGGFDEDPELKIEDYDLWIRLGHYGNFGFLKNIFTYYRVHKSQFSADWETKKMRLEYLARKRNLTLPQYKFYRNKGTFIRLIRNLLHASVYTFYRFVNFN